uniref:Uncharacterized protein n=1 Tax=Anguilla anguilla TaxID=7936 RepID=A0A0E9SZM8_ANGAN
MAAGSRPYSSRFLMRVTFLFEPLEATERSMGSR